MARRAKRKSRRSGSTAFNLKNALLSYASLHIMAENIVGTSPWHFLTAGTRMGVSQSSGWRVTGDAHGSVITLQEILGGAQTAGGSPSNPFTAMGNNLRSNFLPLVFSLAGVKIAGKLITRLGISRQFNALTGKRGLGLQSMVRM